MDIKIIQRNGKYGLVRETHRREILKQGYALSDDEYLHSETVYGEEYVETTQLLPFEYDEIVIVGRDDFFRLRKNDKIGLCYSSYNKHRVLLEPEYHEVELVEDKGSPFIFKADGKFGSWNGKDFAIKPIYDEIRSLYPFLAVRLKGRWGLIASDGTYLVKPKYRSLNVFSLEGNVKSSWLGYSNSSYLVRTNKKYGCMTFYPACYKWQVWPIHSLKKIKSLLERKYDLTINEEEHAKIVKLEQDDTRSGGFLGLFRKKEFQDTTGEQIELSVINPLDPSPQKDSGLQQPLMQAKPTEIAKTSRILDDSSLQMVYQRSLQLAKDEKGNSLCPVCALPFKTEESAYSHIEKWHSK